MSADRRHATQQALMAALESELAKGGTYSDVDIDTLTAACGLSRSTFYAHFSDRSEFLRTCTQAILDDARSRLRPWWSLRDDLSEATVRESFAQAVHDYLPHVTLMRIVFDAARYDDRVSADLRVMTDALVSELAEHIAAAQSRSLADPGLPATVAAELLIAMLERTTHQAMDGLEPGELNRLLDAGGTVIWRALYLPALTGPDSATTGA